MAMTFDLSQLTVESFATEGTEVPGGELFGTRDCVQPTREPGCGEDTTGGWDETLLLTCLTPEPAGVTRERGPVPHGTGPFVFPWRTGRVTPV